MHSILSRNVPSAPCFLDDLTYGTYDVKDLGSGHGSLSVGALVLDKTWGYRAAAVPSPDCCGFSSPLLDLDSAYVDVDGFESIGATATDQCTGQPESIFDSITDWWSGNSAIAQVTKGKATGVSPGTTTANGSGEILECSGNTEYFQQVSPSAPVTVQVPTSLEVISAVVIPVTSLSGCTTLDFGIAGGITYQVLDQNSSPINSGTMEPQEEIFNVVINGSEPFSPEPSWVDIGPSGYPGTSKYTSSSGQFLDAAWGACSNGAFVETLTQPIGILWNGTVYTVRTSYWKTEGIAPNKGSMTNATDVSLSN